MSTEVYTEGSTEVEMEPALPEPTSCDPDPDADAKPKPKPKEHAGPISFPLYIMWALSVLLLLVSAPFTIWYCFKKVEEHMRVIVFRGGRLLPGGPKGPGIFFQIPCLDDFVIVDLRTVSYKLPPQELITTDGVTITVKAAVFYHVEDPTLATIRVEDYNYSTELLSASTVRNVLSTKTVSELLNDREEIAKDLRSTLDEATDPWGVEIERVEIEDVCLPYQMRLGMAAEAVASQGARAKVIAAEAEQNASHALKEAADTIAKSPHALQLRYLQALQTIWAEKKPSTIILPLSVDFLSGCLNKEESSN
ncbi:stomatin-like isoform X2 [Patiria miniata]|uniref:Band 7 domain-containing protein n=1 Tax=Patiria miniata TaxID=46514 RepID=A0A914AUR5_PATMI|nr:stomatin-like isoform X2 [Patiria miniata]